MGSEHFSSVFGADDKNQEDSFAWKRVWVKISASIFCQYVFIMSHTCFKVNRLSTMFVYGLSGCVLESHCSHSVFVLANKFSNFSKFSPTFEGWTSLSKNWTKHSGEIQSLIGYIEILTICPWGYFGRTRMVFDTACLPFLTMIQGLRHFLEKREQKNKGA